MRYLVLAEYVKSGKRLWWNSSVNDIWKKDTITFLPGSITQVKIVDIVDMDIIGKMKQAICEVFDNTEDSNIKETLEEYTYNS
jgi:hypothetical protein